MISTDAILAFIFIEGKKNNANNNAAQLLYLTQILIHRKKYIS